MQNMVVLTTRLWDARASGPETGVVSVRRLSVFRPCNMSGWAPLGWRRAFCDGARNLQPLPTSREAPTTKAGR